MDLSFKLKSLIVEKINAQLQADESSPCKSVEQNVEQLSVLGVYEFLDRDCSPPSSGEASNFSGRCRCVIGLTQASIGRNRQSFGP